MKIYYAHPMCLYGEPDERRHLARIRRQFRRCEIVNPADYNGDPLKMRDTVGFCLKLVKGCDAVVFCRLFGKATAGVGKEVNYALGIGRPVFEVRGAQIVRRTQRVTYISRRNTVRLYNRYRSR
jgi:hypothetical protein